MRIPVEFIIELGFFRKKDKCALCDRDMDVGDYNIQLCRSCRKKELDKYANSTLNSTKDKGESDE